MTFVDSSAFIGRYLDRDQHHHRAVAAWNTLKRGLFTSNLVLSETFTLIGRWGGYKFAHERAERVLNSQATTILRPDEEDEREALVLFGKFADKRISYTDCVSFALMRRHGIKRAFTFDRDFEDAGFERWPA